MYYIHNLPTPNIMIDHIIINNTSVIIKTSHKFPSKIFIFLQLNFNTSIFNIPPEKGYS